jgi:Rod binding domain-containing protein
MSAPGSPVKQLPNVDRANADPQIVKAAEGMESMFIEEMMKVMRQTVPKNEMDLESPATDIYRGMLDTEYAQKAAHAGGVGLADQIIAYLQSQGYTQKRTQNAPPPGQHEGPAKKAPTGGSP